MTVPTICISFIHHLLLLLQLIKLLKSLVQLFLKPGDITLQLFASSVPGLSRSLVLLILFLSLLFNRLLHLQKLSALSQTFLQSILTRQRTEEASSMTVCPSLCNCSKQEYWSPPPADVFYKHSLILQNWKHTLSHAVSYPLTCSSSALGTTSSISVPASSPWESSSRVTRSSSGFGAQKVNLELREHTFPLASIYTNSYSWELGLGR